MLVEDPQRARRAEGDRARRRRDAHDRRDDDVYRAHGLGGGEGAADPRRGLRHDRRRPGAQPRHDRRQRLLERPENHLAADGRGRRVDDDRRSGRRTGGSGGGVLPRRLPHRGRARRAPDPDLDPGREEGRLRRGHAGRRRDVHRERRRVGERHGARRARLRRRRAGGRLGRLGGRGGRRRSRGEPDATVADVHASSEYRTHLAEVLATRAAEEAAAR